MESRQIEPDVFLEKLETMNLAVFDFLSHCSNGGFYQNGRADNCKQEDADMSCSEVMKQFTRPNEFRQTLLDMLKVVIDPNPVGSLMLNSNPCFFTDAVPKRSFSLGYLSVLSEPGEVFSKFWTDTVLPRIEESGYIMAHVKTMFVVVSVGMERHTEDLYAEIIDVTKGGFHIDDALAFFGALLSGDRAPHKDAYTGIVSNDELCDRFRVSLWLYLDPIRRQLLDNAKLFKRAMTAFERTAESTEPDNK